MLLGEYEHTIDDKNRLTLPAKFRESFADGIVVTRGLDGCLYAYRRPDWGRLVDSQLATLDPLSQEGRRLLAVRPGETVVDATFGAGGHAAVLAADLAGSGRMIAIDRDPSVKPYFESFRRRAGGIQARLLRGEFSLVLAQLAENGVQAAAIL